MAIDSHQYKIYYDFTIGEFVAKKVIDMTEFNLSKCERIR
jgi:hypothetical protein